MTESATVAVGAVIVEDGQLLVVKRAAEPHAGRWAVPGGRVRTGETLIEAVEREVLEETGLMVAVGDVAWVGDTIGPGDPPAWHFVIVDFWATRTEGDPIAADDAEQVAWLPVDEASAWPMVDTMYELLDLIKAGL